MSKEKPENNEEQAQVKPIPQEEKKSKKAEAFDIPGTVEFLHNADNEEVEAEQFYRDLKAAIVYSVTHVDKNNKAFIISYATAEYLWEFLKKFPYEKVQGLNILEHEYVDLLSLYNNIMCDTNFYKGKASLHLETKYSQSTKIKKAGNENLFSKYITKLINNNGGKSVLIEDMLMKDKLITVPEESVNKIFACLFSMKYEDVFQIIENLKGSIITI